MRVWLLIFSLTGFAEQNDAAILKLQQALQDLRAEQAEENKRIQAQMKAIEKRLDELQSTGFTPKTQKEIEDTTKALTELTREKRKKSAIELRFAPTPTTLAIACRVGEYKYHGKVIEFQNAKIYGYKCGYTLVENEAGLAEGKEVAIEEGLKECTTLPKYDSDSTCLAFECSQVTCYKMAYVNYENNRKLEEYCGAFPKVNGPLHFDHSNGFTPRYFNNPPLTLPRS